MSLFFESNAYFYLIIFGIVIFLTYIGTHEIKQSHKTIGFIFYGASILVLSLFSGSRSVLVGTDVNVYVVPQLELAEYSSSFLEYFRASDSELLYKTIVYIFSLTKHPIFNLLFIQQLITLIPIYIILYKKRFIVSITFGITVYLFMIYNMSLSIMRQCMAASILILGYLYYREHKRKKAFLLCIIAILLHNFAIVFIIFLFIFNKIKNGKYSNFRSISLVGLFIISILCINPVLSFAVEHGFLRQGVLDRLLETQGGLSVGDFSLRFFLTCLPLIINTITKGKNRTGKDSFAFTQLAFIGTIFSLLALISTYLIRISYYFYFFIPLSISYSVNLFKRNNQCKIYLYFLYSCLLLIYWYFVYINWQWYDTVPFAFSQKI